MAVIDLLIAIIVAFSLTFGWIESPLFNKPRQFIMKHIHPYLGQCYHCVGFYAGILTLILYYLATINILFSIFYYALFFAGTTLLIYRLFFKMIGGSQ